MVVVVGIVRANFCIAFERRCANHCRNWSLLIGVVVVVVVVVDVVVVVVVVVVV